MGLGRRDAGLGRARLSSLQGSESDEPVWFLRRYRIASLALAMTTRISAPPATESLDSRSIRAERHGSERLQQMLIELAGHLFHGREGLGVRERQPVRPLLHERRVDVDDGRQPHDVADPITLQ